MQHNNFMYFTKTINFKTNNLKLIQKSVIGRNILTLNYNMKLCVINIVVE